MARTWATKKKWDRREILRNMKREQIECVVRNYSAGLPVKQIAGLCRIPVIGTIYDIIDAYNLPRRRGHYKRPRMENSWTQYAELLVGKESLYEAYKYGKLSATTYMKLNEGTKEVKRRNLDKYVVFAGYIMDNYNKPVAWKLKMINENGIDPVLLEEATALLFYSVPKTVRRLFYKKIGTKTSFYTGGRRGNVRKEIKKKINAELYTLFKRMLDRNHHPSPKIWGIILGVNTRKLERYLLDKVYPRYNWEKLIKNIYKQEEIPRKIRKSRRTKGTH